MRNERLQFQIKLYRKGGIRNHFVLKLRHDIVIALRKHSLPLLQYVDQFSRYKVNNRRKGNFKRFINALQYDYLSVIDMAIF